MNLDQLRYFSKLAETEHYGRASKELFVSQPALSNSIKSLESELGVALFERVGRNIRLTERGKFFQESVNEALGILNGAVEELDAYQHGRMSLIRIAAVESIERDYLPYLLTEFQKSIGAKVSFDIKRCTTYEAITSLNDGLCDLAFCGRLPNPHHMTFIPLVMQDAVVAMNVDHPLAQKEIISLDDLKGYPLISYNPKSYMYQVFKGVFKHFKLKFKLNFDNEVNAATLVSTSTDTVAIILNTLGDISFPKVTLKKIKELDQPFHLVTCAYINDLRRPMAVDLLISFLEQQRLLDSPEPLERKFFYND